MIREDVANIGELELVQQQAARKGQVSIEPLLSRTGRGLSLSVCQE